LLEVSLLGEQLVEGRTARNLARSSRTIALIGFLAVHGEQREGAGERQSDFVDSRIVVCRRRESNKRRPTVLRAHSVVHLARHDHGLELLKVLRISTPTP